MAHRPFRTSKRYADWGHLNSLKKKLSFQYSTHGKDIVSGMHKSVQNLDDVVSLC